LSAGPSWLVLAEIRVRKTESRFAKSLNRLLQQNLHNAVVSIRGRPLHDYIRLRRLWCVHQALVSGAPAQIKAVALANGFWHPGEFSLSYRAMFGETPSQTLCRAKKE
jgi:AraC family ethanolamine operon transcriptional activator